MTHTAENIGKIGELKTVFQCLDEKGQDSALAILRALAYAQSVMCISQDRNRLGRKRNQESTRGIL